MRHLVRFGLLLAVLASSGLSAKADTTAARPGVLPPEIPFDSEANFLKLPPDL